MSSLKSLYQKGKEGQTLGKYLKQSAPGQLGEGIESQAHLKSLTNKSEYFLPPINYSNPANFVKFGSAYEYYKNTYEYIANYYPYDGSGLEKTNFYNDINPLEKYMLEAVYPRSTGHVVVGIPYKLSTTNASFYDVPTANQFIQVKGGPHKNTKFNVSENRTSNLEFAGPSGSTVEFFFRKGSLMPFPATQSRKQAILDITNGVSVANSASSDYGRLRIALHSGSETQFFVTLLSGTFGFLETPVPSTPGQITISDDAWRNFSFRFNTSRQPASIDLFVDGTCVETGITASAATGIDGSKLIGTVTGTMIGNIGALREGPSTFGGLGIPEGAGLLSASIDEFRFWKAARNDEQIGRYWFTNVEGGTDKYDANVALGVYFKFNEGITGDQTTDVIMLDYSGRVSNGTYTGYQPLYSRSTGSAIDQLNIESVSERGDPIIRTNNPLYISSKAQYESSGSIYDAQNNARLLNHLPNWIIEAEEKSDNEIVNLTQIISGYFDTLYNQLTALKELKYNQYVSGSLTNSIDEFPFNDRLVENLGIQTPELFENADVLSQFFQRDEQINFDQQLVDIKNSIYKNIYNNLNFILKSKGNEKAVRNFIRCLGVGEEILSLNTYSDNTDFELTSSYQTSVSSQKYVDMTGLLNQTDGDATVYQYYDSSNPNSVGLINSGSLTSVSPTQMSEYAFTLQTEVLFPNKDNQELLAYSLPQILTSSLFGFHTPLDPSQTSTDLTWIGAVDDWGLQVYAIRSPGEFAEIYSPLSRVKDAYFAVKNRAGDTLLTSSVYRNVYDNSRWNFALTVKPSKYPFSDGVLGTAVISNGYELGLHGVNYETGKKEHTFHLTSSINYLSGSSTINSAKRIYVGAHRTNFIGSVLTQTDINVSSARYWTDYLSKEALDLQARQVESFGTLHPYRNAYLFQTASLDIYVPTIQTLAMNWDFSTITGSDTSGRFIVPDGSGGTNDGTIFSEYQGQIFSDINLRQHTGRADFFGSLSKPARKQYVYNDVLLPPDYLAGNDMINVLSNDDEVFGTYTKPANSFFAVEKSMYRSVSNRMLELFASIKEFNNLVGEPVNKYRMNYKKMEKLREIFFRKVQNEIVDLQKYLDYYKWLDTAMSQMLDQLLPASARYSPNVRNIIESHTLERNKIQYRFPLLSEPGKPGQKNILVGTVNGPDEDLGVPGDPLNPGAFPPIRPLQPEILDLPNLRIPNVRFVPPDDNGIGDGGVPWPLP